MPAQPASLPEQPKLGIRVDPAIGWGRGPLSQRNAKRFRMIL